MGVMHCARNGCDSILSEYYSPEHGHLCKRCFRELVDSHPTSLEDIEAFMESPKEPEAISVDSYKLIKRVFQETR